MNCRDIDKHSASGYNKFVGLEQPEVKPVEHALVDKPYPWGTRKAIMLGNRKLHL
jgi:hypothetical protein